MVAITQLSLWISALVVLSCQALLVTYIVESETFCEINSTEIDKVSKSVSEFLDDVSTSAKQMNLTNDFIPVCTLNKVEINNSTDLIVFMSERRTSKFPTYLMNSSFPIVTNTYDENRNASVSTLYKTTFLGNSIYAVLNSLDWTYIQVILQPTPYFRNILSEFQRSRDSPYICAIRIFEINSTYNVENMMTALQYETNTRGIVVLTDNMILERIIQFWTSMTDQLYFVALYEDSAIIQRYMESILGWVFIPRQKTNEILTDIPGGVIDSTNLPQTTLREIQSTVNFLTDTWLHANVSGCYKSNEEENDSCIVLKWIKEMKLREQRSHVYNIQIDESNEDTATNTTKAKFIQVGKVHNTQFTSLGSWILYDKENRRLRSTAVSWNKAFHYKCRSHLTFEQLTSPFTSDIQIVGNLPLHYSSYTPEGCGELRNNYVLFSEAIVFAVDYVNNLTDILPSVKLGYDIIDTCSVPSRFIHQMDVLYSLGLKNASVKRKHYIGGVGFPFSSGVESLAHYSYSKKIPTISISATSSKFSDKNLYPYFMRMVPSNKDETLAIISVLEHLKIRSIGIVYSNDAFGSDLTKSVLTFANVKGITVNYMLRIEDSYVENTEILNYLVDMFILKNNEYVQAVLSLTQSQHIKPILQRLNDIEFKSIFWIGCDTWIAGIEKTFLKNNIDVVSNAILIAFETNISEKFLKYMSDKAYLMEQNPFIKKLIEKENNCTVDRSQPAKILCNDVVDFKNLFENVDPHGETHIIDAVISLAHGIDTLIRNHCPLMDYCTEANLHIEELAEIVQKKRITGIDGGKIYYDSKGDGKTVFYIMQIDPTFPSFHRKIGMSLENKILIDNSTLKVPKSIQDKRFTPCTGPDCYSIPTNLIEMPYTFIEGDVMIYAFIELYEFNGVCTNNLILDHFEVATSILWSISNINRKQPKGFPKIGLGLFAACGHDTTLAKSVFKQTFVVPTIPSTPYKKPIIGVIGAITNPVASAMYDARKSSSMDFPMIISASTERFNNREGHPRVFRTVMSSTFDVYLSIKLAKRLGWNYFHALFGNRDQELLNLMKREASALNMCLATNRQIIMQDLENELKTAVDEMLQYDGATVVMVFIPTVAIETLLKIASEKNTAGKLVFIIPKHVENIQTIVSKYKNPSLGLVVIQNNLLENKQFTSYFQHLKIDEGDWTEKLPWGKTFWEDVHQCNLRFSNRYTKDCATDLNLNGLHTKRSPFVASTIHGVYALSKAFQNVLDKHCNSSSFTECVNGNMSEIYHQLEHELDRVTVTPDGGMLFSFDNRNATIPMVILNFQYGPKGNPRLVEVGSVQKEEITLDLRKLSMYNLNGERRIFKSECPDDQCSVCLDPKFVSDYNEKVQYLSSIPHVTLNSFESGVGLTTIFLVIIGVGVAIVCTYYLAKFSSHKIFSLSADGHACIIIGTTVQILGAIVYLFDGSPLACGIHIALPGSVYSITLTGLLIKLNKTACLHAIVKTNITKLPKWDFAFTYLPIVISAPIIIYIVWTLEDPVTMTWSVPSLFQISKIDDIYIQWYCEFNRTEYIIFMCFFWIILFLCMTLSVIYKCRKTGRKEVKQVLFSAICYSLFTTVTTVLRLLTNDHVMFRVFMAITLPLNGIIILIINFLPQIVDLMREKNRELLFTRLMSDNKTSQFANLWKEFIHSENNRTKTKDSKQTKNEKVSLSVVGLSTKWRKKTQSTSTPISTSEA